MTGNSCTNAAPLHASLLLIVFSGRILFLRSSRAHGAYAARAKSWVAKLSFAVVFSVYKATILLPTSILSTSIEPIHPHQRHTSFYDRCYNDLNLSLALINEFVTIDGDQPVYLVYLWWRCRDSHPGLARLYIAINDNSYIYSTILRVCQSFNRINLLR